jgi:hypothetical protein
MKTIHRWLSTVFIMLSLAAVCGAAQQPSKVEPPDYETAIGCLRTINTAEVAYAGTYAQGFSATLAALGMTAGQTVPTAEAAELIDEHLTTGKMGGYHFVYKSGARDKAGHISAYTVTARPLKWQKGVPSFFTDETGVIRWTKQNRAATREDPTIDSLSGSQ